MKRVADELSESKRAKVEPLGFRRWLLVYLGVALQCDVPILEAIHCGIPARLEEYVEAATGVLLARGWRQTAESWDTQIWQGLHRTKIHVTPKETRNHRELEIRCLGSSRATMRVCYAAGHWFVGNDHSMLRASIPSLCRWLEQRLDQVNRIV
jgi:hypothetical protein